MLLGIDLALEDRIAPPHPIGDGVAERGNAFDRRVAAERAEMLL